MRCPSTGGHVPSASEQRAPRREPSTFQRPAKKIPRLPISRNNLSSEKPDRFQWLPADLCRTLYPPGGESDAHDIRVERARNGEKRPVRREREVPDELLGSGVGCLATQPKDERTVVPSAFAIMATQEGSAVGRAAVDWLLAR